MLPEYKFSQPSPRGKPGFESFQSKADDLFYFHYNDKEGRPILFSKGYESARDRSNMMNSARYNVKKPSRYRKVSDKEGKHYFIVLKADGDEEIARSRPFEKKAQRDSAMKEFQQRFQKSKKPKAAERTLLSKEISISSNKPAQDTTRISSRTKFNLTFRQASQGEPLRGEIEYPLTKEKASFQGLDLKAIAGFISRYIPEEKGKTSEPQKVPTPEPTVQGTKIDKEVDIELLNKESGAMLTNFRKGESFDVRVNIASEEVGKKEQRNYFEALVYAKSFDQGNEILIGSGHGVVPQNGQIKITALSRMLPPGIYRINTSVNLKGHHVEKDDARFKGSKILQII